VETIRLSGHLLADDHAAAASLHVRVSRAVWFAFAPLATLLLASGILRAVGTTSPPDNALLFIAVFVVLMPIGRHLGIQRRARQLYAETRGEHHLDISLGEDAISVLSPRGKLTLPWLDIHKWRADEHCILLHLNSATYLILPKRLLTSENAFASVQEKLRATLGRPA
jgi:YcxB-like protein